MLPVGVLLLLIVLLIVSTGCDGGAVNKLVKKLPTCENACVVSARGNPLLEVGEEEYRVWSGEARELVQRYEGKVLNDALKEVNSQLSEGVKSGLPIMQTGFILCHEASSGERFEAVLKHPATQGWRAVALGGRGKSTVGYVALGIWRGEALKRVQMLERGSGGLEVVLKGLERCSGGNDCPMLAVRPGAFTCGELVRLADQLASRERLLGLVGP